MHRNTASPLSAPPWSGLPTVRRSLNNRAPTRRSGRLEIIAVAGPATPEWTICASAQSAWNRSAFAMRPLLNLTTSRVRPLRCYCGYAQSAAQHPAAEVSARSKGSVMLGCGYLTAAYTRGNPTMIIDCAHYQDGHRTGEGPARLAPREASRGTGGGGAARRSGRRPRRAVSPRGRAQHR